MLKCWSEKKVRFSAPSNIQNGGRFRLAGTIGCPVKYAVRSLLKIPGFTLGDVHFLPGFPVMAWPMMEWVLDTNYPHLFRQGAYLEKSVIVFGSMEATLTPLMEQVEREHPQVKVFSLPSVDHPQYGRHIDLGVKGTPDAVEPAYRLLLAGHAVPGVEGGDLVGLGQGREVEGILDEIVQRAFQVEHGLADVDQFGGALANDMDAEQAPGLQREQHFQEA